mmetsp:Transcript_56855/g.51163  ORF Transcript_56855/g.51163 Transcript_56855/m.51163 type:complete len:172 (+) Transcript_56855:41-556(+)
MARSLVLLIFTLWQALTISAYTYTVESFARDLRNVDPGPPDVTDAYLDLDPVDCPGYAGNCDWIPSAPGIPAYQTEIIPDNLNPIWPAVQFVDSSRGTCAIERIYYTVKDGLNTPAPDITLWTEVYPRAPLQYPCPPPPTLPYVFLGGYSGPMFSPLGPTEQVRMKVTISP